MGLTFGKVNFKRNANTVNPARSQTSNSTRSHLESWQKLAAVLEADGEGAGLRQQFPDSSCSCSLLQGLALPDVAATPEQLRRGEAIHAALTTLLGQLRVFEHLSRCPILAITGLLNAGKSSLLATYLSPDNRRRVLRGLSNDSGTHRFVLWLPKIWWDDSELLDTLVAFVSRLFGHPPEHLSADPNVAALQYNGRVVPEALMRGLAAPASPNIAGTANGAERTAAIENGRDGDEGPVEALSVPLIAYDSALDELKLGLLDCPDIQTGFLSLAAREGQPIGVHGSRAGGEALAAARRMQLAKAGRLCSAFVVLSKMGSLHDDGLIQIFTTLRDAMPGVPRILAVNKVKARYSPEVVFQQARGLVDRFGIQSVYAAYDYRSSFAAERIPPAPARMRVVGPERLPIFFETSFPYKLSGRDAVRPRYLHDLGDEMDAGALSRESSRSLRLQLRKQASEVLDWYQKNQQLAETRLNDGWQAFAEACYEFMAERDASGRATGLRLQASPAIVAQMADSLHRTAPTWMKLSLSIDRTARQLQNAVVNSAARFRILQSASENVTNFAKRFRRGEGAQVVTPQRFAQAIRTADRFDVLLRTPQSDLETACELTIQRFAAEDQTQLDSVELDAWSRQVWQGMSFKDKLWKGTQPLGVVLAPLLAAILVPIDGGGTAVLVFASAKELLAAAGIAAVMTPMATGGETLSIVHRETPWRQLSDLFALLCDSVGFPRAGTSDLPRVRFAGASRCLLPSNLAAKPPAIRSAIQTWELHPELMAEVQLTLQSLL